MSNTSLSVALARTKLGNRCFRYASLRSFGNLQALAGDEVNLEPHGERLEMQSGEKGRLRIEQTAQPIGSLTYEPWTQPPNLFYGRVANL